MDSVINGELTEESAEKENVSDKFVAEASSCNSKDNSDVSKNLSVKTSALSSVKENSDNSDLILPLNVTSKVNASNQETNLTIDNSNKLASINSSESNTAENRNYLEISKSSSLPVADSKSNNDTGNNSAESNYFEKECNIQSENFIPLKVADSNASNGDNVEQSLISTNGKQTSGQNITCLTYESNKSSIKSNDESVTALPLNVLNEYLSKTCDKETNESILEPEKTSFLKTDEQISKNGSHQFSSSTAVTVAEENSFIKFSGASEFGCTTSNKINDAHPLEQLNQHLKSIVNECDEIHNYGLPRTASIETSNSMDKTESSKVLSKDGDRHKDTDSFVFTEISKEESGFPDIFAGLVTMGKYISVKGDFTLRSSEALVESPSLIAPYLLKEPDTFPPRTIPAKPEQRGFFQSTAGEFLIGIGLSRVNEWYHRDMARIKKRQMKKEGKSPQHEEDLKMHETIYNEARKANKIYSFPLKSCNICSFSTESTIVMEGHLLVPHITPRREYQCNFCEAINRDPKGMLEHMYRVHGKTGRIQPPVCFFECPYCTFESNSKVKLGNHLTKCQRFYDPNRNQAPPKDFEFPALTPKPITVAVVKAYEKSLSSMQRGRGRPKKIDNITEQMNQFASMNPSSMVSNPLYRQSSTPTLSESLSNLPNTVMPPIQMPNMNLRSPHTNLSQLRSSISPMHLPSPNRFFQVVNSSSQMMPMLGNSPLVTSHSQFPFTPNLVNSASKKVPGPPPPNFLNSFFTSGLRQQNPQKNVPEITITPLPKLAGPYPVPQVKQSTPSNNTSMQGNSLVVCEICDGYIKDLEQLRSHMQLIHKVKIHPKMLVSRPPLNCQKCQWRFFTDQGLERHLLGSHGLVTSNMQELANKGKDAGCCTICGRVYASKLVSHMNQVHKLILKPAHLSYKCTVCSATFNLYRLFENHVYLVHSGAAKRPAEGNSNPLKKFKSHNTNSCESLESEPKNHTDKHTSMFMEEGSGKCVECGIDFRKNSAQNDICEKCLKYDNEGHLMSKMS